MEEREVYMKKYIIYLLMTGVFFTACVSGCSSLNGDVDSSNGLIQTDTTPALPPPTEALETSDIIAETEYNPSTKKISDLSDIFTSDSLDLNAKSISLSGPMCTELVIENTKKIYSDSLGADYPSVEFIPEDHVTALGWWSDKRDVYIHFWNINNEKEVQFLVDGIHCTLTLPEAVFETVEVGSTIDNLGVSYLADSMFVYQDAVVLNLQIESDDSFNFPTIKLKTEQAEHMPSRVNIDSVAGELKILYLLNLNKSNIAATVQDIQGFICNDQFVAFD